MANWQSTLNIKNEMEACREGTITIQELSAKVSTKLDRLAVPNLPEDLKDEQEEFVWEFEAAGEDEDLSVEEYDDILSRLYDWADTSLDGKFGGKKVCWVKTM